MCQMGQKCNLGRTLAAPMKQLLPTLQLDKALAADEAWNKDATLLVSTDEVTVLQTSCKFNIGQDKHIRAAACDFQQCGPGKCSLRQAPSF